MSTFIGVCQATADSTSIKNEEAKKRVLNNLKDQHIMYSNEQEFDFINYLKLPGKNDFSLKLNYKEKPEEKAIRKWNQYKKQPNIFPFYPTFRLENYYFTSY